MAQGLPRGPLGPARHPHSCHGHGQVDDLRVLMTFLQKEMGIDTLLGIGILAWHRDSHGTEIAVPKWDIPAMSKVTVAIKMGFPSLRMFIEETVTGYPIDRAQIEREREPWWVNHVYPPLLIIVHHHRRPSRIVIIDHHKHHFTIII